MNSKAKKESLDQLQKALDFLGSYGGCIEPEDSSKYANLALFVTEDLGPDEDIHKYRSIEIGAYKKTEKGKPVFETVFNLEVTVEGGKIVEAEIIKYSGDVLGKAVTIDTEGDAAGLIKNEDLNLMVDSFSAFMKKIVEEGSYLNDSAKVTKLEKSLLKYFEAGETISL